VEFLFGKQKSPADRIKEYNRSIKKSVRELDRERNTLERQEKKLMGDIKKAAKDGQMDAAKIMAKDLVRTRAYIKKMHKMKSHMEAVSLRLQTMSSSQQMAQCMKGVTKAMGMMNRKVRTLHARGARPRPAAHPRTLRPGAPAWCADEHAADPEDYDGV
jgi:charged multivesicular body protein 2A